MIRSEKSFVELRGNIEIGKPCVIKLPTGELAKTSPVEDYFIGHNGDMKIVTHNSIYRSDSSKHFERGMDDFVYQPKRR